MPFRIALQACWELFVANSCHYTAISRDGVFLDCELASSERLTGKVLEVGVPDGIRTRVIAVKGRFSAFCHTLHEMCRLHGNPVTPHAYCTFQPLLALLSFAPVFWFHRPHSVPF